MSGSSGVARFWQERSAWTLVLTCIFVVILGTLRGNDVSGMAPEAFWAMKSEWKNQADIVFLGNSRTVEGISPAAMQHSLPNSRILNYGIDAVNYTEPYLRMVDELVEKNSLQPVVVLGVSPLTLTDSILYTDGFTALITDEKKSRLGSHFAMLRRFFMPITTRELINSLGPDDRAYHRYRRYHRTGWRESYNIPEDPSETMAFYSTLFEMDRNGPPRREVADHLIAAISRWVAQGIRVYGFRPPTCEAMIALEDAQAHWDEDEFIGRFEMAGGSWISLDEDAYHTYDNCHLDSESAKLLSVHLAARIATNLPVPDEVSKAFPRR